MSVHTVDKRFHAEFTVWVDVQAPDYHSAVARATERLLNGSIDNSSLNLVFDEFDRELDRDGKAVTDD